MDLLQLEHFLAVVDEGSFTRAAERVYRTQSAISQSIKKLEDTVGAPLFARDAPELCLTPSGKLLAEYARHMVRVRDEAMRSLDDLRRLVAGSVSVAAHESAAVYLLPGPLKAYLRTHPEIQVGIYRSRLDEIPRQVLDREVDVGFVKDEPIFRELKCVQIHADQMVLIGSPAHPLASRQISTSRSRRRALRPAPSVRRRRRSGLCSCSSSTAAGARSRRSCGASRT